MSDPVIFYYNPMSRARVVYWMLEEVGCEYEIRTLNFETGEHKKPDFLAINRMGKVPTILHRNTVVTETPAICAYLADAFPNAGLAPPTDSPARGEYYRWLFFNASCMEASHQEKHHPRIETVDPASIGWGRYEDVLDTIEGAVENGFVAGKQFSAADVCVASSLHWFLTIKWIQPREAFMRYVELCSDRPGFHRYMKKAGPIQA